MKLSVFILFYFIINLGKIKAQYFPESASKVRLRLLFLIFGLSGSGRGMPSFSNAFSCYGQISP